MLSVADLRKHVSTSLEDPPLQALLTAAYQAIDPRLPSGPQSELLTVGADVLILSLPAASIESIVDCDIELDPDDYQVVSSTMIRRLATGSHPRLAWVRPLVTYTAIAAAAERDRMAIALVKLDLNYKPGLTGLRIGEYQETFAANSVFNYEIEREAILSSYNQGGGGFV